MLLDDVIKTIKKIIIFLNIFFVRVNNTPTKNIFKKIIIKHYIYGKF